MLEHTQKQDILSAVSTYMLVPGSALATLGAFSVITCVFQVYWYGWLSPALLERMANSLSVNLLFDVGALFSWALYIFVARLVRRGTERRFGSVKPTASDNTKLILEVLVAIPLVCLLGPTIDLHFHSPMSVTLLLFALFLCTHWWMFARSRLHYLVCATSAVILSSVPLLSPMVYNWLYPEQVTSVWYSSNVGVVGSFLLFLVGIFDHWQMVRLLARTRHALGAVRLDERVTFDGEVETKNNE